MTIGTVFVSTAQPRQEPGAEPGHLSAPTQPTAAPTLPTWSATYRRGRAVQY